MLEDTSQTTFNVASEPSRVLVDWLPWPKENNGVRIYHNKLTSPEKV